MVSGQFQQMGANGVQAMMAGQPSIGVERIQQLESRGRAVHHGRGDGVIEHHHGIVGHAFQQVIQRQDLRPVGILGAGRFVVNGGDGGLQLVRANRALRQGRGEERDALGDLRPIPQSCDPVW